MCSFNTLRTHWVPALKHVNIPVSCSSTQTLLPCLARQESPLMCFWPNFSRQKYQPVFFFQKICHFTLNTKNFQTKTSFPKMRSQRFILILRYLCVFDSDPYYRPQLHTLRLLFQMALLLIMKCYIKVRTSGRQKGIFHACKVGT